ncbi:type II toxin-antitoxin system HicB family antitoxin [Candidatus Jorgensenbacteria bacterium]|nr:type II toxin-antitoxin system HicB family antitoxin [Candidatus Jorgensenbacteria bacterium]
METRHYTAIFEKAEEGGYVVTCPALPGLSTEGDTLEEASLMVQDAARGYIESLKDDGISIPQDIETITIPDGVKAIIKTITVTIN